MLTTERIIGGIGILMVLLAIGLQVTASPCELPDGSLSDGCGVVP